MPVQKQMIEYDPATFQSASQSKDGMEINDGTQTKNLSSLPVSSVKKNAPENQLGKQEMKDSIVESRNSDFKTVYNKNVLDQSKHVDESANRREASRDTNMPLQKIQSVNRTTVAPIDADMQKRHRDLML